VYNNVMIDIEALGTLVGRKSVVLSIGIVTFDFKENDDWATLGDTQRWMYVELPILPQEKVGREIDFDTVCWWMQQSAEAKKVFSNPINDAHPEAQLIDLEQKLFQVESFLTPADPEKPYYLWAKPSHYDCPMVKSLFKDFNTDFPIPWWNYRCMHSFVVPARLLGIRDSGRESFKGTAHNALDDAKEQVLEIQGWYRQLKSLRSSGT